MISKYDMKILFWLTCTAGNEWERKPSYWSFQNLKWDKCKPFPAQLILRKKREETNFDHIKKQNTTYSTCEQASHRLSKNERCTETPHECQRVRGSLQRHTHISHLQLTPFKLDSESTVTASCVVVQNMSTVSIY